MLKRKFSDLPHRTSRATDSEASREAIVTGRDWLHRPPFSILGMFTVDLMNIYLPLIELYIWTLIQNLYEQIRMVVFFALL